MISLMEIFFSFYHICGYSLINHPGRTKNTRFTHLSAVGFQLGNFLMVATSYLIGVYKMPQVRTLEFKDVPQFNLMVVYHLSHAVGFIIIFESRFHHGKNKVFMENFVRNKMWLMSQKCSKFYEESSSKMSYEHLSVFFVILLNEITRIVRNLLTGGDLWYYYSVIICRFLIIFRWLQIILYMRLILLQQRSVLHLVKIEDCRITTKFLVALVSQTNTKLYVMSQAISKYFGWSFVLIAFGCLLQVSYVLYMCALHFMYNQNSDVISSRNDLKLFVHDFDDKIFIYTAMFFIILPPSLLLYLGGDLQNKITKTVFDHFIPA